MQKLFLATLFLMFFSSEVFSQMARETSFDDRPHCEEVKGVWRSFGSGCTDQCESKFNKFKICTQAVTSGCDCGKGRCWDGQTCILMKDYLVVYNEEKAEEQKILNKAKNGRKKMAAENQKELLKKIIKNNTLESKNRGNYEYATPQEQKSFATRPQQNQQQRQRSYDDANKQSPLNEYGVTNISNQVVNEANKRDIEIPPSFRSRQTSENSSGAITNDPQGLPQIALPY